MSSKFFYIPLFIYFLFFILSSCEKETEFEANGKTDPLFKSIPPEISKVFFNNEIEENDRFNMVDFFYVYNGGGVAIGDVNNDNLPDLYFTGNMVNDALYINQGNFQFEDRTSSLGIPLEGWSTGVTMVDINHDGLMDIYVCRSGNYETDKRKNLLYINQGDLTFKEEAELYNLADDGYATQAAFFDFDKDGDLDMYLLNHTNEIRNPNNIKPLIADGSGPGNDRLYRNDEDLGEGIIFTEVTNKAGIIFDGLGLGLGIADIDNDGWEDVFVTNDFLANDYIYINQKDGTFREMSGSYLKHVSHFSMGNDIADFNNDGLLDLLTVDMRPSTNYREKKMAGPLNFDTFEKSIRQGYMPQYMRNTLQLNLGPINNGYSFSEIGQLTGIDATDWSWAPLFADFDNDGFKDLFITNGYLRDITDLDFVNYTSSIGANGSIDSLDRVLKQLSKKMPSIRQPNVIFKNDLGMGFLDKTHDWGFSNPSLSNGAAYGDLDNDGDLDLVINNINELASIYENRSTNINKNHYLEIKLRGESQNTLALGAEVRIYQADKFQLNRQSTTRGYQSSVNNTLHFGLGSNDKVDSILVTWPNGITKRILEPKVDQCLTINMNEGSEASFPGHKYETRLFEDVTNALNLEKKKHGDAYYNDFNREYLLPHKLSEQGPGIAIGDLNNDGEEDFFMGGGYNHSGKLFFGSKSGFFQEKKLIYEESKKYSEDTGVLFFDFDNDQDLDLYIASGSNEFYENSEYYEDRLYMNDGTGNLELTQGILPPLNTSNSCVRAADFDKDGDLDLYIGGRLTPLRYPFPCNSYLLENRNGKFIDVTNSIAPSLRKPGMVKDAIWTDFDNDEDLDLIVLGEFMSVEFFENTDGIFTNASSRTGLSHTAGLWNSINAGDFDNDGDIDYVLGNLGLNSKYKASKERPLTIYALDYDRNGSIDPLMTSFRDDFEYPVHTRDDLLKQIPSLKKKFPDYEKYAAATIDDILTKEDKSSAYIIRAFNLASSVLINLGNGKFEMKPLPLEAQTAPIYGISVADYDQDGNLDIVVTGNDFGTEVSVGRYDALKGLYLKGLGNKEFLSVAPMKSGLFVDGNTRGLATINANGTLVEIIGVNDGNIISYKVKGEKGGENYIKIPSEAISADLLLENGKTRFIEFYHGSSYLSQSTKDVFLSGREKKITVYGLDKEILINQILR